MPCLPDPHMLCHCLIFRGTPQILGAQPGREVLPNMASFCLGSPALGTGSESHLFSISFPVYPVKKGKAGKCIPVVRVGQNPHTSIFSIRTAFTVGLCLMPTVSWVHCRAEKYRTNTASPTTSRREFVQFEEAQTTFDLTGILKESILNRPSLWGVLRNICLSWLHFFSIILDFQNVIT